MVVNKTGQEESREQTQRTTKYIAYILLISYAVALAATGLAAYLKSGEDLQIWFDLFKSGFLVLAGALTTIIGYYFGGRGVQEAEERARIYKSERDSVVKEVEALIRKEKEKEAPTTEEESLQVPGEER